MNQINPVSLVPPVSRATMVFQHPASNQAFAGGRVQVL
jgi:hypothetical protein